MAADNFFTFRDIFGQRLHTAKFTVALFIALLLYFLIYPHHHNIPTFFYEENLHKNIPLKSHRETGAADSSKIFIKIALLIINSQSIQVCVVSLG